MLSGSGASDMASRRSVAAVTLVVRVVELLAVLESGPLAETVAVLVMVPMVCGVTTIVTVTLVSLGMDIPRLHRTVPLLNEQEPWLGVAETKVALGGNVSIRVMSETTEGTRFETVSV